MKTNSHTRRNTILRKYKGYSKNFNKLFMLLLLVVFAAGCKKVTEQPGLIGVCPKVISTNPVDKAVGIMINAKIGATFNETMTPSSINTTTFTIQQGSTSIPGVVTYSGTTATFSPSNNLALNTTYTGTIT